MTDNKKLRPRPYFRISIKGYYPKGSTSKLKAVLYTKHGEIIAKLLQFYAELTGS